MSPRLVLIALALAAPLGGCVSLLPKAPPPPKIYTMEAAPAQAPANSAAKPVTIAVGQPSPPRALAGADIAWVKDGQLAYVEGAQWAGRAPDLLQTVLLMTIDRSGLATGAVRSGEGRADTEIAWDLTTFGVVESSAQEAKLVARVKLFGARNRRLISSLEVDESVKLSGRSSAAAAAALQEVARNASAKIAAWAVEQTPLNEPSAATPSERTREPLVAPERAGRPQAPAPRTP